MKRAIGVDFLTAVETTRLDANWQPIPAAKRSSTPTRSRIIGRTRVRSIRCCR
ncbi:MAG: hypothetical protein MZU97_05015 [Bacillus subtilis]|nr:hypothetical protein [Bacillus subtilis]